MMSKWEMLGAITNKHGDDYEPRMVMTLDIDEDHVKSLVKS